MNTLDSRSLRLGDCYAQKFATPGEMRYVVTAGSHGGGAAPKEGSGEGYVIEVKAKQGGGAAKQHNVAVKRAHRGGLTIEPEKLTIEAGDTVLWYTTDPDVGGFSVDGSSKEFSFGNGALKSEAIYTHAFGVAGSIEWVDPLNGKVAGKVEVRPVELKNERERQRWYEALAKGAAFEIRDGKATPESVEVSVGQTVFWKVWDSHGVQIVDKRLA